MVMGIGGQRPWVDHRRWRLRAVQLLASVVLAVPPLVPAAAEVQGCRAWRDSRGVERIRLGNRLGEAQYLTRNRRLQTSPDQAPISLYRPSDLRRLCDDR
jgi:hypothetical protein